MARVGSASVDHPAKVWLYCKTWNPDSQSNNPPTAMLVMFQAPRFWFSAAPLKMPAIVVTSPVFHPLMSWLKVEAPENIDDILITLPVLQELMFWLKVEAPENIEAAETLLLLVPRVQPVIETFMKASPLNMLASVVTFLRSHAPLTTAFMATPLSLK